MAGGLRCSECGAFTRVKNSRRFYDGNRRKRYHICRSCGFEFITVEKFKSGIREYRKKTTICGT